VFVKILLILNCSCRALNIPARYFTCYATNINPPDIHACFEVYIGGQWTSPLAYQILSSLVKIAHGKDGSEVAVANLLKCFLYLYEY
jgi:hypothetical protein